MNHTPLPSPRPGSSPIVTPEGIICGTDGKYRWVSQSFLPFRGSRHCTLFTVDEHSVSSRQVKGRVSRGEAIHAFSVWVGGQSQPALRFYPPKQMDLSVIRRILVWPRKNRIVVRCGLRGLTLQSDPVQLEIISDYLSRHCPRATVTVFD